ncbi:MAG: phage portal protein [Thiomonas sp.]
MAFLDRLRGVFGGRAASPRPDPVQAGIASLFAKARPSRPERDSYVYPRFTPLGAPLVDHQAVYKPVPINLRAFTRTTYCRRAINVIKDPIRQLEWEIRPVKHGKPRPDWERRAMIVTECLRSPNDSDSWGSFIEQLVEDYLVGAASYEQQLSSDPRRPLWMWPVDGMTVQIYPLWTGEDPNTPRYLQVPGWGAAVGNVIGGVQFLDSELVYIRPNPSTGDPFGVGAVQIAFDTIGKYLGVNEYSGKVAANANPNNALWLKDLTPEQRDEIRDYWQNEIEGRGEMPFFGGNEAPQILTFRNGDSSLYLKYMDWLVREIATAFGISPQNMGLEADVNRNTAETSVNRDWDTAIKPVAVAIADHINRHTIHKRLGWHDLEFQFLGMDREDEQAIANINQIYLKNNVLTPNEVREKLGMQPLKSKWGDMLAADVAIATQAAMMLGDDLDPDLYPDKGVAPGKDSGHTPSFDTGGDNAAKPDPTDVRGDE